MSTPGGTSTSLLSISLGVSSEVSNEVEVTPGVLIRALPAAPVGPCYIIYIITCYIFNNYTQTNTQKNTQRDRQTDSKTDRHTYRQTDRQADRQTDSQTDRQTDRQTDTHIFFIFKLGYNSKRLTTFVL